VVVDYTDESTILPSLKGVEVVITALAGAAHDKQKDIIKAAKTAGARLFVSSDYGISTDNVTAGIWLPKVHSDQWLREFGFPYVRVLCGLWPEYALHP
jgi:hypothetical protein